MMSVTEQRIYDKQNAPRVSSAPDSEMDAVIRAHTDCINILQSAITELELRLKPVLPQIVPATTAKDVRNEPQGNLCPLARTIESQSYMLNEMTEDIRRLLGDIRI